VVVPGHPFLHLSCSSEAVSHVVGIFLGHWLGSGSTVEVASRGVAIGGDEALGMEVPGDSLLHGRGGSKALGSLLHLIDSLDIYDALGGSSIDLVEVGDVGRSAVKEAPGLVAIGGDGALGMEVPGDSLLHGRGGSKALSSLLHLIDSLDIYDTLGGRFIDFVEVNDVGRSAVKKAAGLEWGWGVRYNRKLFLFFD
jgi:hypothetical protein